MALPNSEKITSQIAILPDAALKQMAMMHKNDPYVLPLIISEDGRRKQMRQAAQAQMAGMPQPKVADAALAQMGQLPEEQGIGQLPAPNIQRMANGGIAGYEDDQEGMATGGMGGMFNFAQQSEPVVRMAGGGMAGDGVMNFSNGGTNKLSGANLFEKALDMEGITNPRERAFLKALHGQESSGKATEKTSNRNAHGAMQILPGTFKEVADKDMDINKPLDNMRAGIRYGKKGYAAAGGDPVLAGAYYYGGPGGMQKAAKLEYL
jgi:soluble lytic murein transglycosylase-like protein